MKKIFSLFFILIFIGAISSSVMAVDVSDSRMAHNIYSEPDLSETSQRFSAFSIEFKADNTPQGTYWALCNWTMDTFCLSNEYTLLDRGGAYAGLQNTINGKMAIMSFWQIQYQDKRGNIQTLEARCVYPNGAGGRFGGEGEGSNIITPFEWKTGKWYRMLLRCYEDSETKTTMVEQWIMDIDTQEWFLISRFDTGLTDSCFTGSMSQFLENYDSSYSAEYRDFQYRNLFVREEGSDDWIALNRTKLSIDTWWDNKKGSFSFGADDTYFWGNTLGVGEDTAEPNAEISGWFTIYSTDEPDDPPVDLNDRQSSCVKAGHYSSDERSGAPDELDITIDSERNIRFSVSWFRTAVMENAVAVPSDGNALFSYDEGDGHQSTTGYLVFQKNKVTMVLTETIFPLILSDDGSFTQTFTYNEDNE